MTDNVLLHGTPFFISGIPNLKYHWEYHNVINNKIPEFDKHGTSDELPVWWNH